MNKISKIASMVVVISMLLICMSSVAIATNGNDFTFVKNGNDITITGYTGNGGNVSIPSVIDGANVTTIGALAFDGNTNITTIIIPTSVNHLGMGAFAFCTNLTDVNIRNLSLTMDDAVFQGCNKLNFVTIPYYTTVIKSGTFMGCTDLNVVFLPDGVKYIENGAFANSGVYSITIPKSVESIGVWSFGGCENLHIVNTNMTTIPVCAFLDSPNATIFVHVDNVLPAPTPTGSSGDISLWLIGGIIAVFAILAIVVIYIRRLNKK